MKNERDSNYKKIFGQNATDIARTCKTSVNAVYRVFKRAYKNNWNDVSKELNTDKFIDEFSGWIFMNSGDLLYRNRIVKCFTKFINSGGVVVLRENKFRKSKSDTHKEIVLDRVNQAYIDYQEALRNIITKRDVLLNSINDILNDLRLDIIQKQEGDKK